MTLDQPLLFKKPDFHPGVNVTVRLGAKWFGLLNVGDFVEIETTVGYGDDTCPMSWGSYMVLGICFYSNLDSIDPALLKFEHDPMCRTPAGLEEGMAEAYGDDFDASEGFSVVIFYYQPEMVDELG